MVSSMGGAPVAADSTPVRILRQRYEALRTDRVERAIARAHRALVTDSLVLLLAIALFLPHWRWVRRLTSSPSAAPAA